MPGRQNIVTKEALSRLPVLDVRQLREMWCELYKTAAAPRLSRELLMRAVAYRIQELALVGLRPPAAPDRLRAAANRTGYHRPAPSAKARNAVAAGMAGAKPSGAGAK